MSSIALGDHSVTAQKTVVDSDLDPKKQAFSLLAPLFNEEHTAEDANIAVKLTGATNIIAGVALQQTSPAVITIGDTMPSATYHVILGHNDTNFGSDFRLRVTARTDTTFTVAHNSAATPIDYSWFVLYG